MARPGRGNTIPAFQKLDRISEQKWGLKGSIANMVVRTEQSQHFNFYNFLQTMRLEKILSPTCLERHLSVLARPILPVNGPKTVFSSFSGKYVSIFLCVCCNACAAWTTLHRKPLKEYWNTEFHTNYKECAKTASTSLCFTGIGRILQWIQPKTS